MTNHSDDADETTVDERSNSTESEASTGDDGHNHSHGDGGHSHGDDRTDAEGTRY